MTPIRTLLLAAGVAGLAACASTPQESATTATTGATSAAQAPTAMATASTVHNARVNLSAASGSLVSGTLDVMAMGDGLHLTGEIGGLTPNGTHAIHIHEKGDCSAADATSAGGHFNPHGNPHGRAGHGAHHGGDMDNIVADAEGVARVDVHAMGVVLGGGAPNDALGKAVIVHGGADDYTSQPTGDAGNRIACGIIRAQ
ncbi:superoxide dismutase family protein [Novilysobacter defluvii]|uniref:Superoxide dismutase [Cu-Zn] n=1 Tax=Lysobacter defluvii IMMIB APB-9 = DSM 18482 TaxID=1385515 RepID=A0A0A0M7B1_9GAMM|nr:superoxide dismutase family protein [Lysobacter defluvii]KGO98883.1 superoxide dismutase [Lysobacter defluvii IMMIB APB-9 = DSM 18482]